MYVTRLSANLRNRKSNYLVLQTLFALLTMLLLAAAPGRAATPVASQVSAGDEHTCALSSSSGVQCWGNNGQGQLGDGTTTNRTTPTNVSGLTSGVAAISVGLSHTCAVTTAGGAKCWGSNHYGQLGNGTTTDSLTPGDVNGLTSGVAAIEAGWDHTCALTTAGGVKCWGGDLSGAPGEFPSTYRSTPADVIGLTSDVQAISTSHYHACALTFAGGVKCWGSGDTGQLGDGTNTNSSTPVNVSGFASGVNASAVGEDFTCALTNAGGMKCWGFNSVGQLGDGTFTTKLAPVNVSGLTAGVAAIATGSHNGCALTTTGGVKCWGESFYGALGNGSTTDQSTPVDVAGLDSGVSAITAGGYYACALTTTGAVKCWGLNATSQLGDGTTTDRPTPVNVSGIAVGADTSQSITSFTSPSTLALGSTSNLNANASSALSPTFDTFTPSTCTVNSAGLVTPVSQGLCMVRFRQAGNASFKQAPTITRLVLITAASTAQTITFGALGNKTLGDTAFTVSATGGASGNPVTFASQTTSICTTGATNGATVTLLAAGTCTIRASQAGNATFATAPTVDRSFTVAAASGLLPQTINFGNLDDKVLIDEPFTISATGGASGNPVTFASQTPDVCKTGGTNGATVSVEGRGVCTIRASQTGNSTYSAAPDVERSFNVNNPSLSDVVDGAGCVINPNAKFDPTLLLATLLALAYLARRPAHSYK